MQNILQVCWKGKLCCCLYCTLEQVLAASISPSIYLSHLTDVNDVVCLMLGFFFFGSELKAAEGQQNILCQPEILVFKALAYERNQEEVWVFYTLYFKLLETISMRWDSFAIAGKKAEAQDAFVIHIPDVFMCVSAIFALFFSNLRSKPLS